MGNENLSRRAFLRCAGLGAAALVGSLTRSGRAAARPAGPPGGKDMRTRPTRLTEHLFIHRGPIHVGIVLDGRRALLIDCGDGGVLGALRGLGAESVQRVLFTHHHRDQACGAGMLAAGGAEIVVPAEERDHFDKVAAYWNDPKSRWHLYNLHPHHLMLAEPVRVDGVVKGGDAFAWGPAKLRVLATPGHTDGSVSYVVDVDGKRFIFSGDAIYDEGQVWDIHSLQKGTQTTDYHGFLGARRQLAKSLERIKAAKADALIPSHGRIMTDPPKAIDSLVQRLEACYDKYVAISALRHYFPRLFAAYAGRKDHMPIRKGKSVPTCLRHSGTTWLLISKDKAAFVMDCGGPHVVKEIRKRIDAGEIRSVEGLWVTHYHDDHVDGIPAFREAFDCPIITERSVAEVIGDPPAWRLPCISPHQARVDRVTKDGESWAWREFTMTAFHFPGQTLYHAGLLVERGELRMLFAGDSFTMSGIDDYCTSNRNWLGRGVGFDRCVALIEKLQPTHIFNPHVNVAFDFTPQQCRFMRANLAEREELYGQLVPWDHANYGMDEPWVRCQPYEQKASPGGKAAFDVVVMNHSAVARLAACRALLPRAWDRAFSRRSAAAASQPAPATDWASVAVPAKTEGRARLSFGVPRGAKRGRYVIPVDVRYGDWTLPQFTEGIVVL
jgi:glyoxylase-like metal-dependent hydrolase (beta-lactamase superfamily II)